MLLLLSMIIAITIIMEYYVILSLCYILWQYLTYYHISSYIIIIIEYNILSKLLII